MAFSNNFFLVLSLISSNVGGLTKRSTTSALFFIAYCAGNLAGPQLVVSAEKPNYTVCFPVGVRSYITLTDVMVDCVYRYAGRYGCRHCSLDDTEGIP